MAAKAQLVKIGGRRRQTLASLSALDVELREAIRAGVAEGIPIADIARYARVSRPLVYRALRGD